MNINSKPFLSLLAFFLLFSCSAPGGNENTGVLISTTEGDIKIKLYDGTPVHRDNFIKLVQSGIYEGIVFHRVISGFMIQAGDPSTRGGLAREQLDTLGRYTLPAEFHKEYFHKKGALAAAREGNNSNPEMRSSGTQFYIVQGKTYSDEDLAAIESKINATIKQTLFSRVMKEISDSVRLSGTAAPEDYIQEKATARMFKYLTTTGDFRFPTGHIDTYRKLGGTPFLDGSYTVFGEVMEGLDVVDRIASTKTGTADRPLTDIMIKKMKIIKL